MPCRAHRMVAACGLERQGPGASYFTVSLLNFTVRLELPPGGRLMLLEATLPDSTQIIRSYSSSPKSDICCALAIHGFQTTVEADPCFSTMILRPRRGSRISTVPVVFW